jgi:Xaa-Pro aminopeptidase
MRTTSRFQSFDEPTDPSHGPARLAALREELARRGLDGFVVPRADEHQGEYVPASAERLPWLTGFTGSAGLCVALMDVAALFVDGRYTLQVREQADLSAFTPVSTVTTSPEDWIGEHLPKAARLGCDPALHTPAGVARLEKAVARAGGVLVACDTNPLDAVWADRPAPPASAVRLRDIRFSGEAPAAKLARVQAKLGEARCEALLVSDPHATSWLFDIRGGDVHHTPLVLAYALVPREGRPSLFIDAARLSDAVADALGAVAEIAPPSDLAETLRRASAGGARIRLDEATAGQRWKTLVEEAGGIADVGADPIVLMKAVKNPAEIAGARAAQCRDGAAMVEFLAWFAREAPSGRLTEIAAAQALEHFRAATGALRDLSFPTIAGAGPNGAIVHYRVTRRTDRRIEPGTLFLIDSGAQYEDGTTDITRTLAVGEPSREMRERFTRVLKGHIAIARAVFPEGTSGAQIDAFARRPLWEAGLDFDHGTGHGVGSYLSVHEGPQRLSKLGTVALKPGMILSNEPGYYREGHYGIRIENLVLVAPRKLPGAERTMLGFETLTLAPIDLALVEPGLLDEAERAWLDAYHARVREEIGPLVGAQARDWLGLATAGMNSARA